MKVAIIVWLISMCIFSIVFTTVLSVRDSRRIDALETAAAASPTAGAER